MVLVSVLLFPGVLVFCRFMSESGVPILNPPPLRSFFSPSNAATIPVSLLALPCVLLLGKSKQTVTVTVGGYIEWVVSAFTPTTDTAQRFAFNAPG